MKLLKVLFSVGLLASTQIVQVQAQARAVTVPQLNAGHGALGAVIAQTAPNSYPNYVSLVATGLVPASLTAQSAMVVIRDLGIKEESTLAALEAKVAAINFQAGVSNAAESGNANVGALLAGLAGKEDCSLSGLASELPLEVSVAPETRAAAAIAKRALASAAVMAGLLVGASDVEAALRSQEEFLNGAIVDSQVVAGAEKVAVEAANFVVQVAKETTADGVITAAEAARVQCTLYAATSLAAQNAGQTSEEAKKAGLGVAEHCAVPFGGTLFQSTNFGSVVEAEAFCQI